MRMDTVIMGGGLSGLTCGIALAKRGQRVTIVAGGQSTLLFNGGSMELLGSIDGKDITSPLEAIATLPSNILTPKSAPTASPRWPTRPSNCWPTRASRWTATPPPTTGASPPWASPSPPGSR